MDARNKLSLLYPEYGFEDIDVYFDSVYKHESSRADLGELTWRIADIKNAGEILKCVMITITEFRMPIIDAASFTDPATFFYNRFFMQIKSLPTSQAVSVNGNKFYHFEFDLSDYNALAMLATPVNNSFIFQTPINAINDFTCAFTVPHTFRPIKIPRDVINVTSIVNVNPGRFSVDEGDTSDLGEIGVYNPGIVIYTTGFNSTNKNLNAKVNSEQGIFATEITTSRQFAVSPLNFGTLPNIPARIVVAKNRIAFKVRFTVVKNKVTNYLGAIRT